MDISSLFGITIAFSFLIFGVLSGGGEVVTYLNLASLFIVLGGTIGAAMASHSFHQFRKLFAVGLLAFTRQENNPDKIILTLLSFSEKARREGLLALEDDIEETSDSFLRLGIQLVVDGTEPEVVRNIMNAELQSIDKRHGAFVGMYENLAILSPAFGLIGTLIGLIVMMSNLGGDPNAIGRGMAAAIITTLYGSILANCVFTPIARKLEHNNQIEISLKEIIIEGTLSIQSGDNPRILQQKLFSYFEPDVRYNIQNQVGT